MKVLFYSIFCAFLLLLSSNLLAQTSQQQIQSTKMISQFFDGKLKFNPKKTRKLSQKELKDVIINNPSIPTVSQAAIVDYFLPAKIVDWRAIIAEIEADCGKIEVIITLDIANAYNSNIVDVWIPPNNKCEKLLEAFAGEFYSHEVGADEVKPCKFDRCVPWDKKRPNCCVHVIQLIDASTECRTSDEDCSNRGCYCSPMKSTQGYYDLFMITKK